jgi:hypothetical protein
VRPVAWRLRYADGIDALEMMRLPEAADALAARGNAGDPLAVRALARLRDVRSGERLLALLDEPSPRVAFFGAECSPRVGEARRSR